MIAFGYYGGKNSKLKFILPQLQTDHRMYVELCGGSAAVLLNKPRAEFEVLNDRARSVMLFWKAMCEQPDALIEQIQLTPPGEAEFKRILDLPPTDDEIEMARRFFLRVTQAFSTMPASKSHSMIGSHRFIKKRDGLKPVADRMRNVCLESTDAARLIKRCVNVESSIRHSPILFYADPPYTTDSRKSTGEYLCEEFDHAEFLDAVLNAPNYCKFAISGYANQQYDDALADWHRVEAEVVLTATNNKGRAARTEVLWRNYPLMETKSFL